MEQHPELTPAEATKAAMGQITAPIIAITLVLLSVFVPIAFIPGISGELFRQFAVTVAVAMFLSAINALTLSPALCAHPAEAPSWAAARPDRLVMRGIDRVRDVYGAVVARLVRIVGRSAWCWSAPPASASSAGQGHADRLPAAKTTRARSSSSCSCRTAPRSAAPRAWSSRSRRSCRRRTRSPTIPRPSA